LALFDKNLSLGRVPLESFDWHSRGAGAVLRCIHSSSRVAKVNYYFRFVSRGIQREKVRAATVATVAARAFPGFFKKASRAKLESFCLCFELIFTLYLT
jgi:hypothetical protein